MQKKQIFPYINRWYLRYTNNIEFTKEDSLFYWRERIFNVLILVLLILGSLIIAPNIIASLKAETLLITITDVLVYTALVVIFFNKRVKLKTKGIVVIFFVYILSIVLLIFLGPMGPGFIWLASCSIIAALLMGLRASIVTIVINIFIIGILAFLIHKGILQTPFFEAYSVITWTAVSLNVIIFNAITSIPSALLINALERSLKNQKNFKAALYNKNKSIEIEKKEAIEASRMKSAFLANLSHEIRTPMNAIIGFSELIHEECSEIPHAQKYSQYISQNSSYLQSLINDIVNNSLLESGQIKISYTEITINTFFQELLTTIKATPIYQKRSDVDIQFNPDQTISQLKIMTDETHLKQILINLLTNALKYTPQGHINISIKKEIGNLLFCVKDNGVGIPATEQEKIFSQYAKIERKSSHKIPGIGLGLSITKGLTEALGGKIWFESVENKGTSFYFTLPITPTKIIQQPI